MIYKAFNNTNFNEKNSMKFYPYKMTTIKKIFPTKTFQISRSHGDQSCELNFLSIIRLCHDDDDDYEFLRL